MAKYRKKPVVIEAFKWTGDSRQKEEPKWIVEALRRKGAFINFEPNETGEEAIPYLLIKTLEGDMKAYQGDYIIKGVNGEIYPCKPDIFSKTYELVE
jgi:hypothetical protein